MVASRTGSLDRLREAVRARVAGGSLRRVARQVGMSPTGLRNFLDGGVPYQKSRRRLFEWLQREEGGAAHPPLGDTGVADALGALVADLPPERREDAMDALLDTLRTLYDTHAAAAPEWLGELREGADGEPDGEEREEARESKEAGGGSKTA